jgi:two-component sensor histidine kinase
MALQTQRASPEAFVERFEGRLLALSRSHDLLTRRRWTGVSLGELLDQSLAPYADDPQRQIVFEGPELTLSARAGLAFGMVLHELASNAARHGALSAASGSVDIRWSVQEADGGRRLSLHWSERDGPAVKLAPRRGFGLRLAERNITKDLGGGLDVRFRRAGLELALSFPLA